MNARLLNKYAFGLAAAGTGALAAYAFAVRPWHLRWGATDEEISEALPGDEVKPDAKINVTHAITINAPASEVWKWLVQIGQGRDGGGFNARSSACCSGPARSHHEPCGDTVTSRRVSPITAGPRPNT